MVGKLTTRREFWSGGWIYKSKYLSKPTEMYSIRNEYYCIKINKSTRKITHKNNQKKIDKEIRGSYLYCIW